MLAGYGLLCSFEALAWARMSVVGYWFDGAWDWIASEKNGLESGGKRPSHVTRTFSRPGKPTDRPPDLDDTREKKNDMPNTPKLGPIAPLVICAFPRSFDYCGCR
jgi:hypothetical protein